MLDVLMGSSDALPDSASADPPPAPVAWRVLGGGSRARMRTKNGILDVPRARMPSPFPGEPPTRETVADLDAATDLTDADHAGVIVFSDGEELTAFVPAWSGQQLYWAIDGRTVLLSTSARSIAKAIGADVNGCFLSASLIDSFPLGASFRISPWNGVSAIAPFEVLHVNQDLATRTAQIPPDVVPTNASDASVDAGIVRLRTALLEATHRRSQGTASITCDISGGVDSGANAYLLRALHVDFTGVRARANSEWNLDDIWAGHIINDLRIPHVDFPPIGSTSFTFDATSGYPDGNVPDTPIMWSDTEGYVRALRDRLRTGPHVHFTGLGGDELFAPLPTLPWSLMRKRGIGAPRMAIRYCLRNRIPLRRGIPGLLSTTPYGEWLSREFHELAAHGTTRKDELAWSGHFAFPSYMSERGKNLALDLPFDPSGIQPLNRDRTVHQALESLLMQASITQQLGDIFSDSGPKWTSPFLDPRVIRAALALPMRMREHPFLNKPMLYKAMRGLMPREIFARATKGEYSSDAYTSISRQKDQMERDLTGGALADLGIIDVNVLREKFSLKLLSSEFLFELQELASIERWARHVC